MVANLFFLPTENHTSPTLAYIDCFELSRRRKGLVDSICWEKKKKKMMMNKKKKKKNKGRMKK